MNAQRLYRPRILGNLGLGRDATPFNPSLGFGIFTRHFPGDAEGKAWVALADVVSASDGGWSR